MKLSIIKISAAMTPAMAKHKRAILAKVKNLKGDSAIRGMDLKQTLHVSDDVWSRLMQDKDVSKYTACSPIGRIFANPDTIKSCRSEFSWK